MKKFQSYEDFEESMKNSRIPSIDIKDNVMSHIYGKNKDKAYRKRLVAFLVIMVSTFITAFAALTDNNIWQLRSRNGSSVYTYQKSLKERKKEIVGNYHDVSSYQAILKPGEAAALITLNGYSNEVQFVHQPEKFYNLSDLVKKADIDEIVKIPKGFDFTSGDVEYKLSHDINEEIKKAITEAREKGEKIIMVNLKRVDEYNNAALNFRNGSISLKEEIINNNETNLGFNSFDDENVEKLSIHNTEVLYISNNSSHKIIWVDDMSNGIRIKFTVYSSTDTAKEKLINMAEKIIEM